MKTINSIPIWDNGQNLEAKVLNAYAINVTLNTSATFYYALFSETTEGNVGVMLRQGETCMSTEAYLEWGNNDEYAWDWVAEQLNLTITGDYVPPVPPQPEPQPEPDLTIEPETEPEQTIEGEGEE
jgi:hypothetical protein